MRCTRHRKHIVQSYASIIAEHNNEGAQTTLVGKTIRNSLGVKKHTNHVLHSDGISPTLTTIPEICIVGRVHSPFKNMHVCNHSQIDSRSRAIKQQMKNVDGIKPRDILRLRMLYHHWLLSRSIFYLSNILTTTLAEKILLLSTPTAMARLGRT